MWIRHKWHIAHFLTAAFAGLLLLGSCVHDQGRVRDTDFPPVPEGMVAVEVNVSVRNATPEEEHQSRLSGAAHGSSAFALRAEEAGDKDQSAYGSDPLNENKLTNLEVYLFRPDGALAFYFADDQVQRLATSNTTDGSYKIRVLFPAGAAPTEGSNLDIVVVANAVTEIGTVTTRTQLEEKVQDFSGQLNRYNYADDTFTTQSSFLMDGQMSSGAISYNSDRIHVPQATLELKRAVAKIRLRLTKIDITNFQNGQAVKYGLVKGRLPEVKLVRYAEKTKPIATGKPLPQHKTSSTGADLWANTDWKTSLYRKMQWRDLSSIGKTNPATGDKKFYATYPFYACENIWTEKDLDETYLVVSLQLAPINEDGTPIDANDLGKPYYYRLPVNYSLPIEGVVTADEIKRLKRNHLYDITTTIETMGSEDEGDPVEITAGVAIMPWNTPDPIDGTLTVAHYLVIQDHAPVMANEALINVGYISSLPVKTVITEAFYRYHTVEGEFRKAKIGADGKVTVYNEAGAIVESSKMVEPWDGVDVKASPEFLSNGFLSLYHPVPNNYVPFYFRVKVTQYDPNNAAATGLLSDTLLVTQFPPRYVTGQKSPGFVAGSPETTWQIVSGTSSTGEPDFRFMTSLGAVAKFPGRTNEERQNNVIFSRVTTLVPKAGELIGDPSSQTGGQYYERKTRQDPQSNKLISPDFMIASQYGMSVPIGQYTRQNYYYGWSSTWFGSLYQANNQEYGPHGAFWRNKFGANKGPYHTSTAPSGGYAAMYPANPGRPGPTYAYYDDIYNSYQTAEERCYNYFEGDYGRDGDYIEYYRGTLGANKQRTVRKTFKYKGSWRIPTAAELEMIVNLQKDPNSLVKNLMYGDKYWTAETNRVYDFNLGRFWYATGAQEVVRCIFDLWNLPNRETFSRRPMVLMPGERRDISGLPGKYTPAGLAMWHAANRRR